MGWLMYFSILFSSDRQLENGISNSDTNSESNESNPSEGARTGKATNQVSCAAPVVDRLHNRMITRQRSTKVKDVVTNNIKKKESKQRQCKLKDIVTNNVPNEEPKRRQDKHLNKSVVEANRNIPKFIGEASQRDDKLVASDQCQRENGIDGEHTELNDGKQETKPKSDQRLGKANVLDQENNKPSNEMCSDEMIVESNENEEPIDNTIVLSKSECNRVIVVKKESVYYICELCGWIFSETSHSQPTNIPAGVISKPVNITDDVVEFHNKFAHSAEVKSIFQSCKVCGDARDSQDAITHLVLEHSFQFTCKTCQKSILSFSDIPKHLAGHKQCDVKKGEQTNSDANNLKCSYCVLKLQTRYNLERHIKRKHTEKSHSCDKCQKKFAELLELEKHHKVHLRSFVCAIDGCGRAYSSEKKLISHQKNHETKSITCSICGKVCVNHARFNYHMKYHAEDRLLKCTYCGKCFKTQDVLTKHERIHNTTRHYYCEICGKGFDQSGSLQRHMLVHTDSKPHKCTICGHAYRTVPALKMHKLRNNHYNVTEKTDLPSIACDKCGKRFLSRYELNRHIMTHTGEKPYRCSTCNKSFGDKSNLRNHMKIHKDNRSYTCDICERGFLHLKSLRKHMKVHNERKFTSVIKPTGLGTAKNLSSSDQSVSNRITMQGSKPLSRLEKELTTGSSMALGNAMEDSGVTSLSNFDILSAAASQIEKWARENNETQLDEQVEPTLENRYEDQSSEITENTDPNSGNIYINYASYAAAEPISPSAYISKPIATTDQFESSNNTYSNIQILYPVPMMDKWPAADLQQDSYMGIEHLQPEQPVSVLSVSTDNSVTVRNNSESAINYSESAINNPENVLINSVSSINTAANVLISSESSINTAANVLISSESSINSSESVLINSESFINNSETVLKQYTGSTL